MIIWMCVKTVDLGIMMVTTARLIRTPPVFTVMSVSNVSLNHRLYGHRVLTPEILDDHDTSTCPLRISPHGVSEMRIYIFELRSDGY